MSILQILEELSSAKGVGSAKRKIQILKNNKDNKDLKDFFFFCLDPSLNFGQSKIKKDNQLIGKTEQIELSEALVLINDTLVSRKKTGNSAIRFLSKIYASLSTDDKNIIERVISRKPGVGISSSTVNKIWPNLIYSSAYMRCKSYSDKAVRNWNWGDVVSQIKSDGMFFNIPLHKDDMETRSGEQINLRDKNIALEKYFLHEALSKHMENQVLHSEAVCYKDGKAIERSKSNGMINAVKQGANLPFGVEMRIATWDVIPYENFINKTPFKIPYSKRLEWLANAICLLHASVKSPSISLTHSEKVSSKEMAKNHFARCIKDGLEGTVLKSGKGIWKSHDSPNQLKLKNKFNFEVRITGYKKGAGKLASTFGGIEVESEDSLLVTSIGGTTLKDKERKRISDDRENHIGAIVEMQATGLFKNDDGSYGVMHPRYVETRYDKTEADSLARIIQQEKDSLNAY